LTDAWTLDDFRLEFEGVHFLANGTIYGFAAPGGYVIVFMDHSLSKYFFLEATST
jgi:hypothetical protein